MPCRPDWALDPDIYSLLKEAVFAMARGKGDYSDRVSPVVERLMLASPGRFPDELAPQADRVRALVESCTSVGVAGPQIKMGRMTPTVRNEFTRCMLDLFEAVIEDRTRLERAALAA
jgi:hypothetical protein